MGSNSRDNDGDGEDKENMFDDDSSDAEGGSKQGDDEMSSEDSNIDDDDDDEDEGVLEPHSAMRPTRSSSNHANGKGTITVIDVDSPTNGDLPCCGDGEDDVDTDNSGPLDVGEHYLVSRADKNWCK